jgi:hypothetical protein
MKKTSNIMIFAAIALTTGAAIAYDQIRPIDYHELGISLVNEPYCATVKAQAEDFEKTVPGGSSAYTNSIKEACSEPTVKLSDDQYKQEQKELRDLKNSKGTMSDNFWDLSRNVHALTMQARRLDAKVNAAKEADEQFAKDHPEEWKAKKDKEEEERQASIKAEQDRQAEIDAAWAKSEQARKDKEAADLLAAKKWDAEQAAWAKDEAQLQAQTRTLEQQSKQLIQESSAYVDRNHIDPTSTSPDTVSKP